MLVLSSLSTQTNSGGTEFVFPQHMECTPALNKIDEELGCVCSRCSTMNEKDHSSVAGVELKNRLELIVVKWLGVEPLSVVCRVAHIVLGNNGVTPLSKALPDPSHSFYINRL